jgi:enoyl-CoA hydratase
METILTGDPTGADEALRYGLVNRVLPDDQLGQAVDELVQKLIKKSATALRLSKEAVVAANRKGLYEGVAYELKLFSPASLRRRMQRKGFRHSWKRGEARIQQRR